MDTSKLPEGIRVSAEIFYELKYRFYKKFKPVDQAISPFSVDYEHAVKVNRTIFSDEFFLNTERLYFFSYYQDLMLRTTGELAQQFFQELKYIDLDVYYVIEENFSWMILVTNEEIESNSKRSEYQMFFLGQPDKIDKRFIYFGVPYPIGEQLEGPAKKSVELNFKKIFGFPKKYVAHWKTWPEQSLKKLTNEQMTSDVKDNLMDRLYIYFDFYNPILMKVTKKDLLSYLQTYPLMTDLDLYIFDDNLSFCIAQINSATYPFGNIYKKNSN